MKRLISLMLLCLLLFGCTPRQQDTGIRFCYPRKGYIYSVTGGSVAWETRDVTQEDLSYLLRLYLLGPQDEDLEALYPADIRLESASVAGGTVTVTLSPVGNRLTDISFTLAGACLARTCFELSSASTVIIQSGDRRLALDRDSLIFQDTSASLETTAP